MPIGMFGKVSGPPGLARRRGASAIVRPGYSDVYVDSASGTTSGKFSGNALRFSNEGYVQVKPYFDTAYTSPYDIRDGSTGEGTVEFWIRASNYGGSRVFPFYAYNNWAWLWDGSGYGVKGSGSNPYYSSLEYNSPGTPSQVADGNWHHVAFVWNTSGYVQHFRDGSYKGTWDNVSGRPSEFRIGNVTYSGSYDGNATIDIDEIRVSNIRRYTDVGGTTADYTVPTAEFVNDEYTLGIIHCNSTSDTDDRTGTV